MYIVPPLGPTYIDEKCQSIWAKSEVLIYGEHVEEHIVNLRNIMRNIRKQGKLKKKSSLSPPNLGPPIS